MFFTEADLSLTREERDWLSPHSEMLSGESRSLEEAL